MRGAIAPAETDQTTLLEQVLAHPRMEGLDLACGVSTDAPYVVEAVGEERFHVIAFDFGVKAHSPKILSEGGCRVTVIPAETSLEAILAERPDGMFVSNGPGDPSAVENAEAAILHLSENDVPIFGICLGHQLIGLAFGGGTEKLPYGHRGGNHPVRDLADGHVLITSQNHGFAVTGSSKDVPGAKELEVTHLNLNDGTVEGIRHRELPIIAVQYHPEASPGPHDARGHFLQFVQTLDSQ
jgi:carbamoyl-phosphate synthase small subunit